MLENWNMTTLRQCAERIASGLAEKRGVEPGDMDLAKVADVIEQALNTAAREREESTGQRIGGERAAAQERLTQLLSASPAVIYSFEASGNYLPTFVSANIETLLGYTPREYLDNLDFWREHVHPDDLQRAEAEVADLFNNGTHALEYRFRRKDGSYCWVNDEQHVIRDDKGRPIEVVGSWSDITARKHAEEAENAAQRRLSTLLGSAPSVIYSFKASGDFAPIFVSNNIKNLLGYCPEDYLKNAEFWRERVHPNDLRRVEAEQAELFEKGRHIAEYRFRKSDGTYCWVSDEQHVIRDEKGGLVEVVGSWSDITARKAAEQEALEANQRVADAIESISEGFSLYDSDDRLVLGNYKFAELFDYGGGAPKPGMTYEEIVRGAAEQGLIEDAKGRSASWLRQRLAQHRNPAGPILERRADGTWLQISERRISSGGSVAVYSDLTEVKESERKAAAANQLILQSLRYASRIQSAILPARELLASVTSDYFLIWEPRDIVGGDFFWFQPISDGYSIIVGDCTGHGVPGAFMTLIAWGMLTNLVAEAPSSNPSQVLAGLHRGVQSLLGQDQDSGETNDGLEAGVCFINPSKQEMTFAGAHLSLWKTDGEDVLEVKGDRRGLGYRHYAQEADFTNFTLPLNAGDAFYLTTDGLVDQVGGPRGRSYGKRRFRNLLKRNRGAPMQKQAESLRRSLKKFQGQQPRRDDLTVLGFMPLGKGGIHARTRAV
jgi:PAS domain S-box-containing protein